MRKGGGEGEMMHLLMQKQNPLMGSRGFFACSLFHCSVLEGWVRRKVVAALSHRRLSHCTVLGTGQPFSFSSFFTLFAAAAVVRVCCLLDPIISVMILLPFCLHSVLPNIFLLNAFTLLILKSFYWVVEAACLSSLFFLFLARKDPYVFGYEKLKEWKRLKTVQILNCLLSSSSSAQCITFFC